ncbi:high mobility group box domain-containing protein, partial [Coprinopsis sp. MPI-PUGE-AT-0042]
IPRPPNAFILFRSDFWAREKQKLNPVERNHRDISRIAGHCWRNLDPISKQRYYERSIRLREMHRRQYPDYKFKP